MIDAVLIVLAVGSFGSASALILFPGHPWIKWMWHWYVSFELEWCVINWVPYIRVKFIWIQYTPPPWK